LDNTPATPVIYDESNIITLEGLEHVRLRPGMYIGKLGDGTYPDDGIYVLLKEVIDNSIDEYRMGIGKTIEISIQEGCATVRDYGRGIPLGKMVEAVSIMNTGGKYDSKAFKKSVGLNGVGVKAVNALSSFFEVESFRDGKTKRAIFEKGKLKTESEIELCVEQGTGTITSFEPDNTLFEGFHFRDDFIEAMLRNYSYLNTGLHSCLTERRFHRVTVCLTS